MQELSLGTGYPCELYERALPDWHSLSLQVMTQAGLVTEKVWFNFAPRRVHWHRYAGQNFVQRHCIQRKAVRCAKRYAAMPPGERLVVLATLLVGMTGVISQGSNCAAVGSFTG